MLTVLALPILYEKFICLLNTKLVLHIGDWPEGLITLKKLEQVITPLPWGHCFLFNQNTLLHTTCGKSIAIFNWLYQYSNSRWNYSVLNAWIFISKNKTVFWHDITAEWVYVYVILFLFSCCLSGDILVE